MRINSIGIAVLMALLALSSLPAEAQKGFRAGATAGMQNTLLGSAQSSEIDVLNAFCPFLTATLNYNFTPRAGLETGLGYTLYSQNTSQFRNNFNYLTLPLYLRLGGYKKENRKVALSFFGGPNFKFLMAANNLVGDEKNSIRDYTNSFHLDYTFGAGVMYKISEKLMLESHLFTTLFGSGINQFSATGFALTNFSYGLSLGFKYGL